MVAFFIVNYFSCIGRSCSRYGISHAGRFRAGVSTSLAVRDLNEIVLSHNSVAGAKGFASTILRLLRKETDSSVTFTPSYASTFGGLSPLSPFSGLRAPSDVPRSLESNVSVLLVSESGEVRFLSSGSFSTSACLACKQPRLRVQFLSNYYGSGFFVTVDRFLSPRLLVKNAFRARASLF